MFHTSWTSGWFQEFVYPYHLSYGQIGIPCHCSVFCNLQKIKKRCAYALCRRNVHYVDKLLCGKVIILLAKWVMHRASLRSISGNIQFENGSCRYLQICWIRFMRFASTRIGIWEICNKNVTSLAVTKYFHFSRVSHIWFHFYKIIGMDLLTIFSCGQIEKFY